MVAGIGVSVVHKNNKQGVEVQNEMIMKKKLPPPPARALRARWTRSPRPSAIWCRELNEKWTRKGFGSPVASKTVRGDEEVGGGARGLAALWRAKL